MEHSFVCVVVVFTPCFVCVCYSQWSDVAAFFTSGSVPSQPDPPMLSEQFVYSLTISWIKRQNEDEFLLQMEDEATVNILRYHLILVE
jgi:hypothetical protein